jgi:ribonuclease HI
MGTRASSGLRISKAAPVRAGNSYKPQPLATPVALHRSFATRGQRSAGPRAGQGGHNKAVSSLLHLRSTHGIQMQHDGTGKIAYAVVMASRKLCHYFEAFKVRVTSDRGLGELFRNLEVSVWITKWAAELSGYHITFEPKIAIKSQVLADFIVDWTGPATQPDTSAEKVWTIHCDSAWCHAGAGATADITSPTGVKHRYVARLSFALESDRCTNNIAEYEAVILGLRKLRALGVTIYIIRTDSKVVAGQVEKDYAAKDPALMQYLTAVRSLERQFKSFTLQHVDHAKNEEADALAKAAARGEALPFDIF